MPTIDDVQAYWDARPCNIRHSQEPVGTWKFFKDVDRRKRLVEPHIDWFADYPAWKGKRVLEVGCGIGTDTERFARAGAQVTAIDLSIESVALTRQRLWLNNLTGQRGHEHRIVQGNAEELWEMFKGEYFDLVYSFGVIHHTVNPAAIVSGMRMLSHSDTVCKIMVYSKYSWKTIALTKGRVWRDDLVARQSEAESGCPITHTYSRTEAWDLMTNSLFMPTSITKDHIFPYKWQDYAKYKYTKTKLARFLPPDAYHALEKELGWHMLIEAVPC